MMRLEKKKFELPASLPSEMYEATSFALSLGGGGTVCARLNLGYLSPYKSHPRDFTASCGLHASHIGDERHVRFSPVDLSPFVCLQLAGIRLRKLNRPRNRLAYTGRYITFRGNRAIVRTLLHPCI